MFLTLSEHMLSFFVVVFMLNQLKSSFAGRAFACGYITTGIFIELYA